MIKADKTVLQETAYIAAWVFIFSLVMQVVFIVAGHWDYTVLLGNIWGAAVVILNFFFMGLSIQKAVASEATDARKIMKISQSLRTLVMFVWVVIGVVLPCFSTLATIIPLFFPRLAIFMRSFGMNKQKKKEESVQNDSE